MIRTIVRALVVAGCVPALIPGGSCQAPAVRSTEVSARSGQLPLRATSEKLAQFSQSLQELVTKVSPGVVQIEVTGFRAAQEDSRKVINESLMVHERVVGAGVIVDPNGYIMTNAHVVTGAQRIRVTLPATPGTLFEVSGAKKSQVLDAKIIGTQPTMDLALLKVEAHGLPSLHFDPTRIPQSGELVFAIGSPEGLQNSVSMGVVSSAWRQPYPDNPMVFLQTDTPINPGNSGGPLVDVTGAVVGINTFILSNSGGNEGLGFAIPASIVDFVYRNLRQYGYVRHIEIGASAQTITPTLAEGLGLQQSWGVIIADVAPSGPAESAGIQPGDIVSEIDGQRVLGLPGFVATLYQHPATDEVRISVFRGARKLSFRVAAVLVRDDSEQLSELSDPVKSPVSRLGILALDLDDQVRSMLALRLGTGVIVVGKEQGFSGVDTGLQSGDVIHSLNRTPITSVEQLRSAVSQLRAGDGAVLQIERKGQLQYLAFEME